MVTERTLTGETGRSDITGSGGSAALGDGDYDPAVQEGGTPTSDRDSDCVPEIDDAHLPSALADSVTFWITRQ